MSDNNILYLGKLNGVQLDFVTGNLTHISGFTGDIQAAVLQQTVDNSTTGKAVASKGVYDFVTGVSGSLNNLIGSNDSDISALQSATGDLDSRVNSNDSDISALQSATGDLDSRVNSNDSDISALQSATGDLDSRVNSNDSDISALQSATGDLDTRVTALNNVTGDYINTSNTNQTKAGGLTLGTFLTVDGDLSVGGNLAVSGTLTTIETETTIIQDPIITLGSGTSAQDGQDRGIDFIYYSDALASPQTGFFGFDHQTERFVIYTGKSATNEDYDNFPAPFDLSATVDGSTIEYVDGSSYIQVKNNGITNAKLLNSSLTVTAGSGLANGGTVSLGGSTNLDVGAGNGITVGADSISVDPHNGITVDGDGVSVTPGDGILVGAGGVSVTGYQGISVDGDGVSTVSDQTHLNNIEIGADNTTTSIISSYGGIIIGRAFSASGAAISLTTSGNTDSEGTDDELILLASDSTLTAEGTITARGTSSSDSASWKFVSTITDEGTKLSQVTKIYADSGASAWSVSVEKSTNGFEIQGNSNGSANVAWSCTVNYNVITA